MQKTNLEIRRRVLRFKHFTRKGYSLFSVIGREVLIGTLAISTLTYAKADGISVNGRDADSDSLANGNSQRKEEVTSQRELKLEEVVVTGSRAPLTMTEAAKMVSVISREDIDRAGAETINDILKLATGVDVRQRGGFGVQTDISARGGNFDQITILLNGVNISSPHTGHLSADFPVSPDDIERIEVIEGASSRLFGTSAFSGAVNIITKNESKTSALVNAQGGSYGCFGTNGRGTLVTGPVRNSFAVGFNRSDGATENSAFQSTRLYYDGSLNLGGSTSSLKPTPSTLKMNWQIGYSYKPYEANTFYSAASTDQWESNERWMAAVNADITLGKVHLVPQAYFNRWYDHYQWHRNKPAGENYHRVEAKGVSLNAWMEWLWGKTSIGVELRDERIMSTKLGKLLPESEWEQTGGHDGNADTYYKYRDQRCNASIFFEHDILLRQWTFSLGMLANINDGMDSKWRVYPGVDISYRPADSWKLYASWNMALRMPTFTDLYYSGTGIVGNSNLKPEKTNDIQLGTKYRTRGFNCDLQLFYSHGTDMIDWVKYIPHPSSLNPQPSSDGLFHSVNFQRDNLGYEVNAQLLPRELTSERLPLRMLGIKYCYIDEESKYDVNVTASKYAMEYLRHKIIVSADATLFTLHSQLSSGLCSPEYPLVETSRKSSARTLNLHIDWRWQDRVGEDNAPYGLLDGMLSWDTNRYSIYVSATNILNREYYDYVSIKQPGFCIMGGMKWKF